MSSRVYNLVITNVPGPQHPLYAAGSRMLAAYPVVPLTKNQALSVGLISYDGGVYCGLYADRDAVPDLVGVDRRHPGQVAGVAQLGQHPTCAVGRRHHQPVVATGRGHRPAQRPDLLVGEGQVPVEEADEVLALRLAEGPTALVHVGEEPEVPPRRLRAR